MKILFSLAACLFLAGGSVSAATLVADVCTSGQCQFFGGNVTVDLSVDSGDLIIAATNNLTSGAVSQIGFNFDPLVSQQNYAPIISSSSTTGGDGVQLSNIQFINGIGNFIIDIGIGGFDSSGNASSWAPGETVTIRLNTNPDFTASLLTGATLAVQVQGAGGTSPVGGPGSFQIFGSEDGTVPPNETVPEPSTLLTLGVGIAGIAAYSRRSRR